MNYAAEQRIRFIDVMLVVYGKVNRKVLTEQYGIADACATNDLRTYKDLYPDNMVYDVSERAYFKAPGFKRAYE